jgi:hypothetical protein
MLKQRDAEIDRGLEEVGQGVQVCDNNLILPLFYIRIFTTKKIINFQVLKEMALEMSDAADVTAVMMDEVDQRVEQNLAQVQVTLTEIILLKISLFCQYLSSILVFLKCTFLKL